ncbi:prepilin-type N-terminal cleavage/methylation domain-containing protein [Vibrio sp. JPW-9-11-11]|uniref:prepilin-type N-terminal cleavage/methylation domain-containing protein n=1 Tax=Vibrio sp. JPW-9-11-11 TaxID=1416532 RepID=UPI0015939ABC|nr:prepilin-type N-terminal cleavage/methylation domain-containing protein [Vibrio sp. JPW-9-11-11]NVD07582.1 prepilin-type N-terminal cleavage/methylation domain-containing protein [Vibrio sp. JPW-9-11-11]
MARLKHTGFTLVELIVVIILVAIVSLYAASRYIGRSSFAPAVAQEQVISVIRQVQVNRMQSNVDSSCSSDSKVALRISSTCLGSIEGCTLTSAQRSDWVAIDEVRFSPTVNCLEFNLLGEPSQVVDVQIRSGSATCQVSINSNGYVAPGSCS